jgi:hypothetical protein
VQSHSASKENDGALKVRCQLAARTTGQAEAEHLSQLIRQNAKGVLKLRAIGTFRRRGIERSN